MTILFADVVGSYQLVENNDPEDAQKALNPILEAMAEAVETHDGVVMQFLGDGIMALFGAPISLEDHAVAGALAAIQIQAIFDSKALQVEGLNIQVRIGLNSGEAVVGVFGSKKVSTYGAIGEAVHLASRMEQTAKPGCIYSTFETVKLTNGRIPFTYVGPMKVKGVTKSVQVYKVAPHPHNAPVLIEPASKELSKFVGRDVELAQLDRMLGLVDRGELACVSLIGDAGIGKSRLIREFLQRPAASRFLVLKSYAKSYANTAPYYAIIVMLQSYLDISPVDASEDIRNKIRLRMEELSLDQDDVATSLLYLFDALEPDHPFTALDSNARAKAIENAIARLLILQSELQPVIVVFEDLHWMDIATSEFIPDLVENAKASRMLIIVSCRKGHENIVQLPDDSLRLTINPLDNESASILIGNIFGDKPDTKRLNNGLVRKCEGNPLFAEEMARAAIEDRALWDAWAETKSSEFAMETNLPSTVRTILASRIDGLPNHCKFLLQVASVIGLTGPIDLLIAVEGDHPGDLSESFDILKERGFVTLKIQKDDAWYVFRHVLVQEVAYASLLLESRKNIHAAIVDETERVFFQQLEQHSESLANHAFLGENWPKAVAYLRRSGEAAADRNAFEQAAAFYNRALVAMQKLPAGSDKATLEIDLRFLLRNAVQPLGDRKQIYAILQEARKLAETHGDQSRSGWVQSYLTDHFWIVGEYDQSIEAGKRALEIAETTSDLKLRVVTNLPLGLSYHTIGAYRKAVSHFQWNANAMSKDNPAERFGLFVLPLPFSQSFIAWSLAELGEFEESRKVGEAGLLIAQQASHPFSIGYAYLGLGVASLRRGMTEQAIEEFQHALSDQAFADSPVGFSFVALHLGYAYVLSGRPDEGMALLEKTVTLAKEKGFVARHSLRLAYLSDALLAVNKGDDALRSGQRAVDLAKSLGERANEAFALYVLGRIHTRVGEKSKAEECLRSSLALSEALGLLPTKVNCLNELALLYSDVGKTSEADTFARRSIQLSEELGMISLLPS
ncbi:ATP-binding protein [Roseobacter sp.]|uniref:ATP-binding protein n=1 Tax=Roseobacter sp. TaxID=1907202 RepID=UPI00385CCB6B